MQISALYGEYLHKLLAFKGEEIKDLCIFAQIFEID